VSDAWRTLQQSYREVDRLFADLQPPVFARQDWMGSVYARRTLGDDTQVEVSYLAEHFLLAWNDWWGLCDRYLRYFGQPEEKLPRTWRTLGARCFPSIMKQVREHLIRCMDKTRVVIVLCDHWRPGMLDDHFGDLQAHYDRGVRFLFLMVGTPGRVVAPVAVDLSLKG